MRRKPLIVAGRVTTGPTDGTYTELVNAPLQEGVRVVTRATATGATAVQRNTTSSPLMPSGPPRR